MKEFGIYTVDKKYLNEFLSVENNLASLKITKRPFVCIKLGLFNLLVPISSINPNSTEYNYKSRLRKQNDYNFVDKKNEPKAMDIFDDLLKNRHTRF